MQSSNLGFACVVLLAAVLALLFAFLPGSAIANHVQCGDTITQDTTLDSDLVCAGDGLAVAGGGVTLDLNGHSITGSGTGTGIAATSGPLVEVRGGVVRSFGAAIFSDGPEALTVDDMAIERNGSGVTCNYTAECRVTDGVFRHNARTAINAYSPDSGGIAEVRGNLVRDNGTGIAITDYTATVADNRVERNSGVGVVLDFGAEVEMVRNVVSRNGGDGVLITFNSDAHLESNRIDDNGGDGVEADGTGSFGVRADVVGNRISGNRGDGILIGSRVRALVERNRTDRNGDDGIDVDSVNPAELDTVVVSANRAFFNADLGIEAAPGTVDGGGNRAKHNGNPAQCTGVVCKQAAYPRPLIRGGS